MTVRRHRCPYCGTLRNHPIQSLNSATDQCECVSCGRTFYRTVGGLGETSAKSEQRRQQQR